MSLPLANSFWLNRMTRRQTVGAREWWAGRRWWLRRGRTAASGDDVGVITHGDKLRIFGFVLTNGGQADALLAQGLRDLCHDRLADRAR